MASAASAFEVHPRLSSFFIAVVRLHCDIGTLLIASGRRKQWIVVGCPTAIFNRLFKLAAIRIWIYFHRSGAIGAVIVTVATEVLMLVGGLHLKPSEAIDRAKASFVTWVDLPMIPIVLAVGAANLAANVRIGVTSCVAGSLLVRTVSVKEACAAFSKHRYAILRRTAV